MFKRPASPKKKLTSKSAYAIAFAMPFISLCGELKASTKLLTENKLFVGNNQIGNLNLKKQIVEKKIVSDSCEALIGAIYLDKGFDFVEKLLASHDYDVFNHTHKERIVSLFKKVKDNANKSASSAKASVDWVSDFEKHSSRFSKSAVSVRGSVGGESTKDGRGDGKFGER